MHNDLYVESDYILWYHPTPPFMPYSYPHSMLINYLWKLYQSCHLIFSYLQKTATMKFWSKSKLIFPLEFDCSLHLLPSHIYQILQIIKNSISNNIYTYILYNNNGCWSFLGLINGKYTSFSWCLPNLHTYYFNLLIYDCAYRK